MWWSCGGGGELCWDCQEVGRGSLHQHHLQHIRINRLEKNWVFQNLSQEGSINLGSSRVHSVLGKWRRGLRLVLAVEVPIPGAPLGQAGGPHQEEQEQQELARDHPTAEEGIGSSPLGCPVTKAGQEVRWYSRTCEKQLSGWRGWADCCYTEVAGWRPWSCFVSWENRAAP